MEEGVEEGKERGRAGFIQYKRSLLAIKIGFMRMFLKRSPVVNVIDIPYPYDLRKIFTVLSHRPSPFCHPCAGSDML